MFSIFLKKKKVARKLDDPKDLQLGDIITLKPRLMLPLELQGASLTVKKICGYEYESGLVSEFSLESVDGQIVGMTLDSEDDGDYLCFSRKLTHGEIKNIFDEPIHGSLRLI